jgi:hypothetical protein
VTEELQLTRRSLLQAVTAIAATAAVTLQARDTLDADQVPEAELINDTPADSPRTLGATKLELFLKARGIKPAHLARECGYSRQHLLRLRLGRMEPTRGCIAAIVVACRRITRTKVKAAALFDLGGMRDERPLADEHSLHVRARQGAPLVREAHGERPVQRLRVHGVHAGGGVRMRPWEEGARQGAMPPQVSLRMLSIPGEEDRRSWMN